MRRTVPASSDVLAGPRGLDGGIEREQVGPEGDAVDGDDDVDDARRSGVDLAKKS